MPRTGYTVIGWLVWRAGRLYLHRRMRHGATKKQRTLAAGAGALLALAVLIGARRTTSASS